MYSNGKEIIINQKEARMVKIEEDWDGLRVVFLDETVYMLGNLANLLEVTQSLRSL